MICPDFDQLFYPILNAVRISPDFDQLSQFGEKVGADGAVEVVKHMGKAKRCQQGMKFFIWSAFRALVNAWFGQKRKVGTKRLANEFMRKSHRGIGPTGIRSSSQASVDNQSLGVATFSPKWRWRALSAFCFQQYNCQKQHK